MNTTTARSKDNEQHHGNSKQNEGKKMKHIRIAISSNTRPMTDQNLLDGVFGVPIFSVGEVHPVSERIDTSRNRSDYSFGETNYHGINHNNMVFYNRGNYEITKITGRGSNMYAVCAPIC